MRLIPFLLCVIVLGACVDRSIIPYISTGDETVQTTRIFVATNRDQNDLGQFLGRRGDHVSYLDVEVSIPTQRSTGSVRTNQNRTDPSRHFAVTQQAEIENGAEFIRSLNAALVQQPPGEREVMIYVHGYNNSFSDGIFRMAQIMHDFEVPATAVHYSWPSAMNPFGYVHDLDSVLAARDELEKVLFEVSQSGADRVILTGHSMGTLLVMETLRQIELTQPGWSNDHLSGVVLISPDISVDLFHAQADRIQDLPQPFAIFVSQRDRALQLSARLTGVRERLGAIRDAEPVAELPVTVVDVSAFTDGPLGHFTVGTSPALIALLSRGSLVSEAFRDDRSGRSGLLPGTVITMQNATQLILSPGLLQPQ